MFLCVQPSWLTKKCSAVLKAVQPVVFFKYPRKQNFEEFLQKLWRNFFKSCNEISLKFQLQDRDGGGEGADRGAERERHSHRKCVQGKHTYHATYHVFFIEKWKKATVVGCNSCLIFVRITMSVFDHLKNKYWTEKWI